MKLYLKNGNQVDLYFNEKVLDYEGNDELLKKDHYAVYEIEEYQGYETIAKTLFTSTSKNECIVFMLSVIVNIKDQKRSYLYNRYKNW